MKSPPSIGQTSSGQELFIGGFSGLIFKNTLVSNKGELQFTSITDRGPNGYLVEKERPFLIPSFNPKIVNLKVNLNEKTFQVSDTINLKRKNGTPLTGVPSIRTEENPVDIYGHMISLDPDGIDTESIVSDDEGGYWIGEEYSPSLLHFDANGKMLQRLTPFNGLPKQYNERIPNRGFEGIAKIKNRLLGFLQSPLVTDKTFSRIVEVDLDTMKTTHEYFYPMDKDKERIGDVINLNDNQFLVVEQNGKTDEKARKAIYKITLLGGENLVKKELIIDLGVTAFKNLEKVEGIALVDQHTIALVNDNDFQITEKTNHETAITPLNSKGNELLLLEFVEDLLK
jgi:3-phytase